IPVTADRTSRRVIGIVTDRDVCLTSYRLEKPLAELCVRDSMTQPVRTCSPEASASETEYAMRHARVRRLPVVDEGGSMVGIGARRTDGAGRARQGGTRARPAATRLEIGAALAEICTPRPRE